MTLMNLYLGGIPTKDATLPVASTLARTYIGACLRFTGFRSSCTNQNHPLDSRVHVYRNAIGVAQER